MNIAIFGGAFNPIHKAHTTLAENVLKDLKILDSSVFDDFSINENQIREKLSEIKKVDVFSMMKGKK